MTTFDFLHQYTSADHAEVFELTRKKTFAKQRGRLFWLGLLIVIAFFLLWIFQADSSFVWFFMGATIGWVTYLSTAWKQQRQYWEKIWEDNSSFRDELRTKMDSDGLRRHSSNTEFVGRWKAFTSIEETANLFVLYTGTSWFLTIPKRVCETPAQLEEIKAFLLSKIPQGII